jgi:hypothetical protein
LLYACTAAESVQTERKFVSSKIGALSNSFHFRLQRSGFKLDFSVNRVCGDRLVLQTMVYAARCRPRRILKVKEKAVGMVAQRPSECGGWIAVISASKIDRASPLSLFNNIFNRLSIARSELCLKHCLFGRQIEFVIYCLRSIPALPVTYSWSRRRLARSGFVLQRLPIANRRFTGLPIETFGRG